MVRPLIVPAGAVPMPMTPVAEREPSALGPITRRLLSVAPRLAKSPEDWCPFTSWKLSIAVIARGVFVGDVSVMFDPVLNRPMLAVPTEGGMLASNRKLKTEL